MASNRQKRCATCGDKFTPPKDNPRRANCYTCRPPMKRPGGRTPVGPPTDEIPEQSGPGRIEAAAAAELARCKREHTYLGAVALLLAAALDAPGLPEARMSALAAQLERTMEKATAGAEAVKDGLDARQDDLQAKIRAVS